MAPGIEKEIICETLEKDEMAPGKTQAELARRSTVLSLTSESKREREVAQKRLVFNSRQAAAHTTHQPATASQESPESSAHNSHLSPPSL
jgi:hypothetical protein